MTLNLNIFLFDIIREEFFVSRSVLLHHFCLIQGAKSLPCKTISRCFKVKGKHIAVFLLQARSMLLAFNKALANLNFCLMLIVTFK